MPTSAIERLRRDVGANETSLPSADAQDLLDEAAARRAGVERAIDAVEAEMGPGFLMRGRGFKPRKPD